MIILRSGGCFRPLGLIFPSIVIIIISSKVLQKFKDSRIVQDAFYGLRPARKWKLPPSAYIGMAAVVGVVFQF